MIPVIDREVEPDVSELDEDEPDVSEPNGVDIGVASVKETPPA